MSSAGADLEPRRRGRPPPGRPRGVRSTSRCVARTVERRRSRRDVDRPLHRLAAGSRLARPDADRVDRRSRDGVSSPMACEHAGPTSRRSHASASARSDRPAPDRRAEHRVRRQSSTALTVEVHAGGLPRTSVDVIFTAAADLCRSGRGPARGATLGGMSIAAGAHVPPAPQPDVASGGRDRVDERSRCWRRPACIARTDAPHRSWRERRLDIRVEATSTQPSRLEHATAPGTERRLTPSPGPTTVEAVGTSADSSRPSLAVDWTVDAARGASTCQPSGRRYRCGTARGRGGGRASTSDEPLGHPSLAGRRRSWVRSPPSAGHSAAVARSTNTPSVLHPTGVLAGLGGLASRLRLTASAGCHARKQLAWPRPGCWASKANQPSVGSSPGGGRMRSRSPPADVGVEDRARDRRSRRRCARCRRPRTRRRPAGPRRRRCRPSRSRTRTSAPAMNTPLTPRIRALRRSICGSSFDRHGVVRGVGVGRRRTRVQLTRSSGSIRGRPRRAA